MDAGLGDLLRRSASEHPAKGAVWCDGRAQTYGELFRRACRLARALAGLGVQHGERVAMLGPNAFETVEQIGGIALGGYVRAGLYAHQTGEVNGYLLDLVGARALLVAAPLHAEIAPHLGGIEHVIVYGGDAPAGTLAYEELVSAAADADPHVESDPDDLHVIRFSAGTTGRPKGIVHTNRAWRAMIAEYRIAVPQITERDCYLAAGQLTHAAVIFLWPMLQSGAEIVVLPAFEPDRVLELIQTRRVTFTLVVPTMIQALVADPGARTRDLSSLRCLNYAASPISETTMARALEVFGEVLYQLYAQSEAVPATMLQPHEHREHPRSVGRATPNTTITIVGEDGVPLPPGEVGEVAVLSPGNMTSLWKDADGTAARVLPDGSVLTRDMGHLDERGFLHLADRKEDMIISGGYNIWPAALENAIAAHPAVAEVCVVGVPHERWGETPIAVVVLAPGASVEPQELIELTREKVGSVQKVTAVEFADELPKTPIGKVLRREVRERYWAGRGPGRLGGA